MKVHCRNNRHVSFTSFNNENAKEYKFASIVTLDNPSDEAY